MQRVSHLIVHKPKAILLLILLLTGFFAYHARDIRLDSSVDSLLATNDPEREYYNEVRRLFGSDEIGVIGVIADNIYTPQVLQKIKRLTDEIKQIPEVKDVISLTNVQDIITSVAKEYTLLVPDVNAPHAALEELRSKLAEQPIYLKNLVSADGRASAINIFFANLGDNEFFRRGVDDTIQALVDREGNGPEKLYYTGLPHFKVHSTRAMWGDLTLFIPLTLLLIVVVLFFSFRSLRGVLLPTLTVVVSLIWTLGIMVLAGSSLSLGNLALPPLVLVLGTAYSLHIVAEYYELAHPGRPVREVMLETLQTTSSPLFIAALTTVLGFLSLIVNSIVSIRELGLYASIGISIAFGLSLVMVPALLALMPLPARREEAFSPGISAALRKLARLSSRYRRTVITVGFLITVFCAWQISAIEVGSDFQSFFRETDPVRQATDAINRHLVGSMTFYVAIDGAEHDIIKKWDTLWRIKNLQLYIDSLPGVEKTVSFVDYCELLDRGIQEIPLEPPEGELFEASQTEDKTTFWANPDQLKGVMRLVFLNAARVASVVNHPNYSRTVILVRTSLSRSSDIADLVEQIESFAAGHFPPELTVHPTGNLILLTRTTGNIVSGQIQSLALSAGVIFVLMAAMFLSARVGLIAMVPNVFPLFVFFGLMGVSGVELNFGTNIIASIALGVAVDDTIHIMTRLSSTIRTTSDQEQALLETLSTVGKPALYASVVLFLGFLTLSFSSFVPIREFGFLSAITILVGLIGEIALLPAMLATTPIITLWDLLHVKLGKDPHKTIGIFTDLRPSQAKIAALMGELKFFPRGHAIIRSGEVSDEMFVMISGRAEVRVNSAGQPRSVWELHRGDLFGVTSLVRSEERISDVVALEDVEVLAMDERFRRRIWRYPRTAARIFFNISSYLLDRLQYTMQRTSEVREERRASQR